MKSRPVVVVLAAGRGSRFDDSLHKLGQPLAGASVLGQVLRNVLESHLSLVVVTTESLAEEACRSVASRDVVLVPQTAVDAPPGVQLGMGYSISAGVAARSHASAWLILPGDMPMVQPATLLALAPQLEHHPVVYAQHQGRRGHPVGFAAELYTELIALKGDEGARRLVARYPAHAVDVDDPGVLIDIDTHADLIDVRAAQQASGALLRSL